MMITTLVNYKTTNKKAVKVMRGYCREYMTDTIKTTFFRGSFSNDYHITTLNSHYRWRILSSHTFHNLFSEKRLQYDAILPFENIKKCVKYISDVQPSVSLKKLL